MGRRGQIHIHGVLTRAHHAALTRALLAACTAAALALVALPTGASADPRVPPPSCPPELSLAALERAPGGVVFTGAVTSVEPDIGLVTLAVIDWYHRGRVAGLDRGVHPATVRILLGNGLGLAGDMVPARMPQAGSRFLVAGTWARAERPVIVRCGTVANLMYDAGAARLAEAETRFATFAPTPEGLGLPAVPLGEPWLVLALTIAGLLVAAAVLETVADARDPLPAT
jgi:hypothetical protein